MSAADEEAASPLNQQVGRCHAASKCQRMPCRL